MDIVRSEFKNVDNIDDRAEINILVPGGYITRYWRAEQLPNIHLPGAGLGRLAWQLAKEGYSCQANETSLFMLFVANFILNHCNKIDQHTVYP